MKSWVFILLLLLGCGSKDVVVNRGAVANKRVDVLGSQAPERFLFLGPNIRIDMATGNVDLSERLAKSQFRTESSKEFWAAVTTEFKTNLERLKSSLELSNHKLKGHEFVIKDLKKKLKEAREKAKDGKKAQKKRKKAKKNS